MRKSCYVLLLLLLAIGLCAQETGYLMTWGTIVGGPVSQNIVGISAGWNHSILITSDGFLQGMGSNGSGQCYVPGGSYSSVDASEYHNVALKSDGSISAWGYGVSQDLVPAGSDFVAVKTGGHTSRNGYYDEFYAFGIALRSNGTIVSWGNNEFGQCNIPTGNDFIEIEAGPAHCLAIRSDGSLVSWGWGVSQAEIPVGNDFRAIAIGGSANVTHYNRDNYGYNLALKENGSIIAWGYNNYGQCSVPQGNNYIAISAGATHGLALKADGSLIGWGANYNGQCNVPAGNDFVAISAGGDFSLALKSDGTVVFIGGNGTFPYEIPSSNCYVSISGNGFSYLSGSGAHTTVHSSYYTLALIIDGSVNGWGNNNAILNHIPTNIDASAVSSGPSHVLILKANGTMTAWGTNYWGECDVPDGNTYAAISAGGYWVTHEDVTFDFNLALKIDGSIIAWGYNEDGQCLVPAGNEYVSISAGGRHCIALKADGSLVAWGDNSEGQCNVPPGNDYVAISAGLYHSLAIKTDGSLIAWGSNSLGECDVPVGISFVSISAGIYTNLAIMSDRTAVAWGSYGSYIDHVPQRNDFVAIDCGFNTFTSIVTGENTHNDDNSSSSQVLSYITAYPNPFRQTSAVTFESKLKANEHGTLSIYNLKGQRVKTFAINATQPKLNWDGRDGNNRQCSAGIYFYRLSTNNQHETKKLVILK